MDLTTTSTTSAATESGAQTATAIIAINVILAAISTITCAGRFWARKLTGVGWGLDDWLALASLVVNHAFCAVTVEATVNGGLGRTILVVMAEDPAKLVTFLKVSDCVIPGTEN